MWRWVLVTLFRLPLMVRHECCWDGGLKVVGGVGGGSGFEAVFCTYQIKIFSQRCVLDVKFARRSIVTAALVEVWE